MFYFYCPNCQNEDEVKTLPKGTVGNPRDGYGRIIHHYECPVCHNLDAGYMREDFGDEDERIYFQHVIGMYQNIRGIKKA